ncbi:NACHT, LRR and PYD domains-containing protein 6-like [Thunnus maccoyii]|uniref:NACHT, LRR and PYD domains-containing protein 6-like n=1 Tax=Thunnus maccoyii TaxID=8240 RepID=UPI001C4C1FE7|nr:NACHT, LRR and PYD domains-containing protein 6-like [Thunnus maccoyii]
MEKLKEELLNTLEKLSKKQFKRFKWYLKQDGVLVGFKGIPVAQLEKAGREDTVDLMVQKHQDHGALQLTMKVLEKMGRKDLVQRLQKKAKAETGLQDVSEYKKSLRMRIQHVTEGTDESGRPLLNTIYTELYITDGTNKETRHDTPIKCHDIFKVLPNQPKHIIKVVMTNGVAGVGKTFSVQKFTLDWAEGSENQDVSLSSAGSLVQF